MFIIYDSIYMVHVLVQPGWCPTFQSQDVKVRSRENADCSVASFHNFTTTGGERIMQGAV